MYRPFAGQSFRVKRDRDAQGDANQRSEAKTLYRLLGFAWPHRSMLLLGLLLMTSGAGVALIPPYLTKPLIDNVLMPASMGVRSVRYQEVVWFLVGFVGASILAWLLTWARTVVMSWMSERIAADLRDQTYEHLQSLSLDFFSGRRTGDLLSRVSTDTERLCYFLSVSVLDFLNDILALLLTAAILFSIDPHLALATLLPLPLIVYLVHRVRRRLHRGFAKVSRTWGEMTSVLADAISGVRVVKAFAQERREVERFREVNRRVFLANCRVNALWSFFEPMVSLFSALGLAVVWGYGSWRIFQQDLTIGALNLFVIYIGRFYGRMDGISRIVVAVQRAAASAQRIFAILDRDPSVAEPEQPVAVGRIQGRIEFRNVAFRYGIRSVLHDMSITVEPGEMIGLVGASGAGKTTTVNLVCRFFDVSEGAIFVDGVDIRSYPLEAYRRNIGMVLQEPFLFYGTIADNIAYGRPDASQAAIIAAAKAANAHDFILRLPDGYDSTVGERGESLSGGERQRISIARALLVNPRLLVLDEATSSVDTETERQIQTALENLTRGRTTLVIAHRLSTLRRADRLILLDRGRVAEVGSHAELLRRNGPYAKLYRAQFERMESE
jgi:ATP-binding cassette subfamily B protein